MIILGYILATLMGLTLGLVGAGGSILAVPVLVYFFNIQPFIATSYSLLIVGMTALVGAIFYYKKDLVKIKVALTFSLPATLSVFLTRLFIVPNLPETIFLIPKDIFVMLLFSVLMFLAALLMFKPHIIRNKDEKSAFCKKCILILGSLGIGFITGIIGVGGGFLIIPTLIFLFKLEMKEAIGTSLTIITLNSLVGFNGDLIAGLNIDWNLLAPFIILTILGMMMGVCISNKFDNEKLKKIFAIFVMIIAMMIFTNELNVLIN